MVRKETKVIGSKLIFSISRHRTVLMAVTALIFFSAVKEFRLLPDARAVDNWEVDGTNGKLFVHGALTESACRLEMDSARQDIWIGEVATGRLFQVGDRSMPMLVELRLRDCLRIPSMTRDEQTSTVYWASDQPTVRIRFQAITDPDNPQLVKAEGVSGLGIRLIDADGQDVRLGRRDKPLWLAPGNDVLTYKVAVERTAAALKAGSYQAVVDFSLSYD